MKIFIRFISVLCLSIVLTGCDSAIEKVMAKYLKMSLKDTCGKQDPACVAAVDSQFDACHAKYEGDWRALLNSTDSEEASFQAVYSTNLYGCIVDKEGKPYFFHNPEKLKEH